MNQIDLEKEMADGGRAKAMSKFANNEASGNAHSNPYAQALYRRTVVPLAEAIKAYCNERSPGVAAKNKGLLRSEDPMTLAFLTIRTVMDKCLTEHSQRQSDLAREIGSLIYGEVLLKHFEDINPELYMTLVKDFERRLSKSASHRLAVFKDSAKKDGIPLPVWDMQTKADVGKLLIGACVDLGILNIDMQRDSRTGKTIGYATIMPEIIELLDQIKGFVAGLMPSVMPCVEPPKPWVTVNDGGYHSPAMRRAQPTVVRNCPMVDDDVVPQLVLDAINHLQAVPWQVNEKVLEVALFAHQHFDVQDVLVSDRREERPDRPVWLTEDMKPEDMSPLQLTEFNGWKATLREWYTETKIRGSKAGATNEALYMANRFKGRPLWYVYTADFRGRFYASAGRGISPQGNDLGKALLQFHDESPIDTPDAEFWFRVAGANRWAADGLDKKPLAERAQWSKDNAEFICRIADDPLSYREWTDADVPFQFLAWCFEFAAWHRDPVAFRSRLPLGQDGSCNGLQHFSAMLRDEVGGRSTNLVPDTTQHDIYGDVARATAQLIATAPEADECLVAARWRRHPLSRALVKRSVMTLPYGSTRFSCSDFIKSEYLDKGKAPEFEKHEYSAAANWLSFRVWDGINQVVVKGREAMDWLQMSANVLTWDKPTTISWRSPSGFLVTQRYHQKDVLRVRCRLMGRKQTEINLQVDSDVGSTSNHRNGIAPNFVHGCDAAHMHFFLERCRAEGLKTLALIHDDYGCPARDVAKLHRIVRETFVEMYRTHDPLEEFRAFHERSDLLLPPVPAKGNLDLNVVLDSPYFFC